MASSKNQGQSTSNVTTHTPSISLQGLTTAQITQVEKDIARHIRENNTESETDTNVYTDSRMEQTHSNQQLTDTIVMLGKQLIDQVYSSICDIVEVVNQTISTAVSCQKSVTTEHISSLSNRVELICHNLEQTQDTVGTLHKLDIMSSFHRNTITNKISRFI